MGVKLGVKPVKPGDRSRKCMTEQSFGQWMGRSV